MLMIKKLLVLICVLFSLCYSYAQCNELDETKVLLIGDSWAFFMGVDGTFNEVFERWGHDNVKFYTNIEVAVNGARTTDFLKANMQAEIQGVINSNPDIDVVHLSIGGNDVLGQWDVGFTQAELDDLIDEVYTQTDSIIRFLKTLKPGIKVVFSGYAYPNFEEVIEDANPLGTSHPFYSRWEGMGFPTFIEINTILNDFSELIEDYADADPQVEFYKAPGILQYTFGQTTPLAVAPGGSYAPFTQPMPFGDPNYPSPQNSMRDYFGITRDCFHLSPKGYRDLIGFHTQKFYQKHFMDDQYLLANSASSGTVSDLQNVSSDLKVGVTANEEFGAILDFNTTDMNWNGVSEAEIFLQIESLSGDNPLNSALEMSIVSGAFGSNPQVESADWSATFDAGASPCVFGSKDNAGRWVRIRVPNEFLPYIQNNTTTQFMIKSTLTTDGIVEFNNTSDPEFAPVLNLKYDENYVGIKEQVANTSVKLFPNPTNDVLTLVSTDEKITGIKVYNQLGQLVLESEKYTRVFVGDLPSGIYRVGVHFKQGMAMKSFLKK